MPTFHRSPFRLWCLLLGFCLIAGSPAPVDAQQGEVVKILVLPFEINAAPDLNHLHEGLPELLREELRAEGFEVYPADQTLQLLRAQELVELDLASAKDMALLSGSAYSIYGSFSQIGESLSLDVRLVEAFGLKPAKSFFVVEEGLINLLPAVQELSEKITRDLRQLETIAEIQVQGNEILGSDVILLRIRSQQGQTYDPQVVNEDVRRLFDLGYFDDIEIRVEDTPEGKVLTFVVTERPRIQAISVVGAKELKESDILKALSTRTGGVVNPKILSEDLAKVREMYRQKGYYLAQVDYSDCLIDWVDREMHPHFVAPLTSRGRALVALIHEEENRLMEQGVLPIEGGLRVAQEGQFAMTELSYFGRLPRIRAFQEIILSERAPAA